MLVRTPAAQEVPQHLRVRTLIITSIGSMGKLSLFMLVMRGILITSGHRHPSAVTHRIMADYVNEVLEWCRVL